MASTLVKGRENLNDGNTYSRYVRLRLVVGNVFRSLGSGGGNTISGGVLRYNNNNKNVELYETRR